MKINLYSPCLQPELATGVEPNTDMSPLALLDLNDVPSLQVWKDGNRIAIDHLLNALFVHVLRGIVLPSNAPIDVTCV
ncbi:hypothetical protein PTKIN_Ptkin14bG0077400 [Pterospermum kingtungense]